MMMAMTTTTNPIPEPKTELYQLLTLHLNNVRATRPAHWIGQTRWMYENHAVVIADNCNVMDIIAACRIPSDRFLDPDGAPIPSWEPVSLRGIAAWLTITTGHNVTQEPIRTWWRDDPRSVGEPGARAGRPSAHTLRGAERIAARPQPRRTPG